MTASTLLATAAHAINEANDHDYANMLVAIANAHDAGNIDISQCADIGECVGVYARSLLTEHDPVRFGTLAHSDDPASSREGNDR